MLKGKESGIEITESAKPYADLGADKLDAILEIPRDAETLAPLRGLDAPARVLAAARVGTTRLIDNMAV